SLRSYNLTLLAAARELAAGEQTELGVARPVAERAEPLAVAAPLHPPADQAAHRLVELLGRNAAEDGPGDRRVGAEPAAQEDVVGLAPPALLVAHGRPLEADVADPVVGARVRAAVQVQPQAR